tara:strand:+ start:239 stop:622 length:384 start_codon:yes stop_codon:yes gene_type:complete
MIKYIIFFIVSFQLSFGQDINKALNEISSQMNQNLPMVIDKYTTLLTTYGGNGRILYRYKLDTNLFIDYGLTKDKWINAQKKSIKNTFCTSPSMSLFRDYDVIVTWNYVDLDGEFISKIEMNRDKCY